MFLEIMYFFGFELRKFNLYEFGMCIRWMEFNFIRLKIYFNCFNGDSVLKIYCYIL